MEHDHSIIAATFLPQLLIFIWNCQQAALPSRRKIICIEPKTKDHVPRNLRHGDTTFGALDFARFFITLVARSLDIVNGLRESRCSEEAGLVV